MFLESRFSGPGFLGFGSRVRDQVLEVAGFANYICHNHAIFTIEGDL